MPKKTVHSSASKKHIDERKNTFHRHFMTVTPLSKAIAIFLFILLPIVAFTLGMKYQNEIDKFSFYQSLFAPSTQNSVELGSKDNGGIKYVRVGDTVLIKNANSERISLKSSDESILKPIGDTGQVFRAVALGRAVLTGSMSPICETGKLCPQLAILYRVDIVVK